MVDIVADLTHYNFNQVYDLSIIEFLNYACYLKDKDAWKNDGLNKMKNNGMD